MKIKTTLLCLLLAVSFASDIAKAQQTTFSKVLHDSMQNGQIQANSMVRTADNGYIIAGKSFSQNGLILKLDSTGNLLWNKTIDNHNANLSPDVILRDIISTNDSCYLLVGMAYNATAGHFDACCIKINFEGDTVWSKTIGQSGFDYSAISIQQTNDSGFIITGNVSTGLLPSELIFATKLNAGGNLQWTTILTGGNCSNIGYSVKQTPDDGYVIIGYMEDCTWNTYSMNTILIKLSSNGTLSWAKKYHLVSMDVSSGNDVIITSNGFLCYLNTGSLNHDSTITLMKTDFSGNVLWSKTYNEYSGGGGSCPGCVTPKLHETSDNGYVFVNGSQNGGMTDGLITKTDSTGNLLWVKNLFLNAVDVIESKDKGLFIIGNGCCMQQTYKPVIGIIKADSIGNGQNCISTGSTYFTVIDSIIGSPATFTSSTGSTENIIHPGVNSIAIGSYQGCVDVMVGIHESDDNGIFVYPNPSNGKYNVKLSVGVNGSEINIIVYNLLGEILLNIKTNNNLSQIDLSNLPNGIYIIRVNANSRSFNQRLIKL